MEEIIKDIKEYLNYTKELTDKDKIERELKMIVNINYIDETTLNITIKEKKESEKIKLKYDLNQTTII